MSDTSQITDDSAEKDTKPNDAPDTGANTDWQAEATKWKELARKHEDRAKSNAEKAKAYEDYLESQKSEEQKRAEQYQALESERDQAMAQAERYRAGLKYGLSDEDLALLGPGEDFDKRAKALAERIHSDPRRRNLAQNSEVKPSGGRSDEWIRMHF